MVEPSERLLRLVSVARLQAIAFQELSAKRGLGDSSSDQEGFTPKFTLGIDIEDASEGDAAEFAIHLRFEAEMAEGSIAVEPVASYLVPIGDRELLDKKLLTEYANEVGVMTIVPYVRQAVADVAARVFDMQLVMPILPRGALQFEVP